MKLPQKQAWRILVHRNWNGCDAGAAARALPILFSLAASPRAGRAG
ncbi:hypothetical protein [Azorhizobium doebereinerae]|nr:hypothetical protein [Azorhizobium doebereinerae]